jgi:hypothetical protein
MAAECGPRTGRPYSHDLGAEDARVRELIHAARVDVFDGRPVDRALSAQVKAELAADRAAFEAEKAAKDAADLAEWRERRE